MIVDLDGEIYYWKSSPGINGGHVNFGTILKKSYANILYVKKEKRLEEYRKLFNPDAPSRMKCNYASPGLIGFCQKNNLWRKGGSIYEVQVYGKGYLTDGDIYTEFIKCKKKDEYNIAKKYWNFNNSYNIRPELIIDGKVIIRYKIC